MPKEMEERSSFRSNRQSLGLDPITRSPRDDLAGSEMELAGAIRRRRAVVVDVADKAAAAVADDLGPGPVYAPVIERLEERSDFVLLLESELGGVHGGEGEGALVACLEVEVGREEMEGVEVEVRAALLAAVYRSHDRGDFGRR